MKKANVANQKITLILAFLLSSELMVTYGNVNAGRDTWIALVITIIGSLIFYAIYYLILILHPGQELYSIIEQTFGKILGKIITLLYCCYGVIVATLAFYKFVTFIRILSFVNTPFLFIGAIVLIVAYLLSRAGIKSIIQIYVILFPIFFVLLVISLLLLLPNYKFSHVFPLLKTPYRQIGISALSFWVVSFGDAILIMGLGINIFPKVKYWQTFGKGTVLGGLVYLSVILMLLFVFDAPLIELLIYPTYSAIALIDVAQFITRIQVLLASLFINVILLKMLLGITFTTEGLLTVFPKGKRPFFIFVMLILVLGLSYIMFPRFEAIRNFKERYAWYKAIMQNGIPIIMICVIVIKKIVKSLQNKANTSISNQ